MRNEINRCATTLDGLTILRYTHATERTGGIEQYLDDINNALLQRNKITVVQLFLPLICHDKSEACERVGRGMLIKVPMITQKQENSRNNSLTVKRILKGLGISGMIRDKIVYNPIFHCYFKRFLVTRSYARYDREPLNVKEKVEGIFERHKPDLIVIHSAGGFGSSEVIREATYRDIPYLILNHFSNSWFMRVGFREEVPGAAGVGGVSGRNIPKYMRTVYQNLSDGIDTEFFKRDQTKPEAGKKAAPLIMLPARAVPGKGHRDLIQAAQLLKKKGVEFKIVFAGRKNDAVFTLSIEKLMHKLRVSDSVIFAGELSREELRRWYTLSSVAVLPSYSEGLGRVLLEAQSMGLPVVAYNVGGVSDAILDHVSGYLVRKGNISDLASRIYELLIDDRKRTAMGNAGREFIEKNFSFPVFAKRHEEWYLRALNNPAR